MFQTQLDTVTKKFQISVFSDPLEIVDINLLQKKFDVFLGGWTEIKLSETFRPFIGNNLQFKLEKVLPQN